MQRAQLFAAAAAGVVLTVAFLLRPYDTARLQPAGNAMTFTDRNGLLLGTIIGTGERRSMAVGLDRMSPNFVHAMLAAEDARFFNHPALDGRSVLRALFGALREGAVPHGGSTISIQLARTIDPVGTGFAGKVREIVDAQRIENTLDKRTILEAYCNRVPMGSNIYGVEAAARTYFGTPAAGLDLAQAAVLAAIPNNPVTLDPYRHWNAARARARFVLQRMEAAGFISRVQARWAAAEHLILAPRDVGIVAAPHYLFELARHLPHARTVVQTTIDRPLQQFAEAQTRDVVSALSDRNVHDAAVIVIDNHSGETLAYVGSPDYFDDARYGRNDGVQALRQPGSTLKPFLYGLALERHAVASTSLLLDAPVAYGLPGGRLYEPADYSQRYLGFVRLRIALANSLNVPAVRLLERVGVDAFLARLHDLGFSHLTKNPEYYGLGLALGGGEVSLGELAHAYARLATSTDPADRLVTDILADAHARADAFGVDSALALPFAAAVKTGTSSGHRDTWTAGFTRDYTVATWVGNFDGSAMQRVSGISGAAPLWARIMLHLHERRDPAGFTAPAGYIRRPICAQTGGAPDAGCQHVVMEYVAGKPIVPSGEPPSLITFPADGDRFALVPGGTVQRIRLRFSLRPSRVAIDAVPLTQQGDAYVWRVRPGTHILEARAGLAREFSHFTVGLPLQAVHRGFTIGRPAS